MLTDGKDEGSAALPAEVVREVHARGVLLDSVVVWLPLTLTLTLTLDSPRSTVIPKEEGVGSEENGKKNSERHFGKLVWRALL